jgi:hypothetical protein
MPRCCSSHLGHLVDDALHVLHVHAGHAALGIGEHRVVAPPGRLRWLWLLRPMAAAIHSGAGCCRWSCTAHRVNVLKEQGSLVLPLPQGIVPVMDTGDAG